MKLYLVFKLIYLRSIAKQAFKLILITIGRSFQMVSIFLFFERGVIGERSQTCTYMLSAKQGTIWYHFYNVFGMTRSEIEHTTSRSRGECSNHCATAAETLLDFWRKLTQHFLKKHVLKSNTLVQVDYSYDFIMNKENLHVHILNDLFSLIFEKHYTCMLHILQELWGYITASYEALFAPLAAKTN